MLEIILGIITAFGIGFTSGYIVGKSYQKTITEHAYNLCPIMKKQDPDGKWEHSKLIFYNGKIKTVICDWLSKKKRCSFTSKKCHYL